jgi:hypothetical protein
MTEALAGETCTPCRGGIPPLTREQAELFHAQAPDWQLLEDSPHRAEYGAAAISGMPEANQMSVMTSTTLKIFQR